MNRDLPGPLAVTLLLSLCVGMAGLLHAAPAEALPA